MSNERHRHFLEKCLQHIEQFMNDFQGVTDDSETHLDFAIAAQQLRSALRCIGHITGSVSTEEILDVIFRDFCIGK